VIIFAPVRRILPGLVNSELNSLLFRIECHSCSWSAWLDVYIPE